MSTEAAGPPGAAAAVSVCGAALGPVVTVACVDAVWTPGTLRTRWHTHTHNHRWCDGSWINSEGAGLTSGADVPDPARVTLAGTIDWVTGTVVGAQAGLSAGFTELSSGTHCEHMHTHGHPEHSGQATPTAQATPTLFSVRQEPDEGISAGSLR